MTPSTLRGRLTLWYGGLLASVLLLFGIGFYAALARNLYREVDHKLLALAEVVAESSVRNFLRPGYTNFSRLLEEFFGVPAAGQFIQVLDPSGKVGARSENLLLRNLPVRREALARAAHGQMVYETVPDPQAPLRVLTYPVVVRGRVRNIVQVATGLESVQATLREVLLALGVGIPLSLFLVLWGGWMIAGRALRPLDGLISAVRTMDADQLGLRVPEDAGTEEVRDLARSINGLLRRLGDAFRRVREFTADASHELRTPLTVLRGEAEVALRQPRSAEEYQRILASSLEEIHRMGRIVEDLLLLAKGDLGEAQVERIPLELGEVLEDLAGRAAPLAEAKGLAFHWAGGPRVRVEADPLRLRQLVWNLLDNAIKYTPEGGRIFLSHARRAPGWVHIAVKDTGVGIPPEYHQKVFERFYRVDKHRSRAQGGSGLGLAICRWIAEVHGGRIELRSRPGAGSTFLVHLPEAAEGEGPAREARARSPAQPSAARPSRR